MPPFWFLYVLFLIFLITPTVKTKKQGCILLGIAAAACIAIGFLNEQFKIVYAVEHTLTYWIWFVFGIFIAKVNLQKLNSPYSLILFAISFIAEFFNFKYLNGSNFAVNLLISVFACVGIIGFISAIYKKNKQTPVMGFFCKIHNTDFPYAHHFCSRNKKCTFQIENNKFNHSHSIRLNYNIHRPRNRCGYYGKNSP